jgi:hypothetical protein
VVDANGRSRRSRTARRLAAVWPGNVRSGEIFELLNDDLIIMLEGHLGVIETTQVHPDALAAGAGNSGGEDM